MSMSAMGALSFSLKLFCPPWRHHMYHLLPLFDIMATTFCKFSVCHFSLKARNTKMWSIAILFNYDLDFVILETICHNTASRLVMNQSKRGTHTYVCPKWFRHMMKFLDTVRSRIPHRKMNIHFLHWNVQNRAMSLYLG